MSHSNRAMVPGSRLLASDEAELGPLCAPTPTIVVQRKKSSIAKKAKLSGNHLDDISRSEHKGGRFLELNERTHSIEPIPFSKEKKEASLVSSGSRSKKLNVSRRTQESDTPGKHKSCTYNEASRQDEKHYRSEKLTSRRQMQEPDAHGKRTSCTNNETSYQEQQRYMSETLNLSRQTEESVNSRKRNLCTHKERSYQEVADDFKTSKSHSNMASSKVQNGQGQHFSAPSEVERQKSVHTKAHALEKKISNAVMDGNQTSFTKSRNVDEESQRESREKIKSVGNKQITSYEELSRSVSERRVGEAEDHNERGRLLKKRGTNILSSSVSGKSNKESGVLPEQFNKTKLTLDHTKIGETISGSKELISGNDSAEVAQGRREKTLILSDQTDRDVTILSYDISRGLEKKKISCLNEYNGAFLPEDFVYINKSEITAQAHVDKSLNRIGDMHCSCFGDCLTSTTPCKCTNDTRGEYAYDEKGLLIQRLAYNYCSQDRQKNRTDFITECNVKCRCSSECGNRVVQRGLKHHLQVFMTKEGKGWGVRALKPIPARSFLFEYVGEIMTNTEQYHRNVEYARDNIHTYTMLLDADHDMETKHFKEGLNDDEALTLDATRFGNVSRFVNHRCGDPNLFIRPVQIETRDTHYYHVAFFAQRDIANMEELTWDYAINFDDQHEVKGFRCLCGSDLCRDRKNKAP